jgi:hypothetical protein
MTQIVEMTIAELQAESTRCESAIGEAETIIADLRARLVDIRAELSRRLKPSPEPRVSDHALLRYVERVMGIDVEAIRSDILTDGVKAALRTGATGITVNGVKMVAKDGVVVTVLADDMRPKKKTKRGWFKDEINEEAA